MIRVVQHYWETTLRFVLLKKCVSFSDLPGRARIHYYCGKNAMWLSILEIHFFPHFRFPKGETLESHLRKRVSWRWKQYGFSLKPRNRRARKRFWNVLIMNFPSSTPWDFRLFLIVGDFCAVGEISKHSRGSLVVEVLLVLSFRMRWPLPTSIPFGTILFERFLNPEQVSMPDIDIDFLMSAEMKCWSMCAINMGKIVWRKFVRLERWQLVLR